MSDCTNSKAPSESNDGNDGHEDISSDFFDDFNKEEFIEGLNVIDTWNDDAGPKRPTKEDKTPTDKTQEETTRKKDSASTDHSRRSIKQSPSGDTKLDEYIKPGSRRDPAKTNAAILKDKEVKVKNHLAKHLDAVAGSDLCPPGTELDDFFEDTAKKTSFPPVQEEKVLLQKSKSKEKQHREAIKRRSPRMRRSPHRSPRRSPQRAQFRRSPIRDSRLYKRKSPFKSYRKTSPRRSPRRHSPIRTRRSPRRSRSPIPRKYRRSHSSSRERGRFNMPDRSEPKSYPPNPYPYEPMPPNYPMIEPSQFPPMPDMYGQGMMYPDYGGYGYTPQPPQGMIMPQQPIMSSSDVPHCPPVIPSGPVAIPSHNPLGNPSEAVETPYDALEKLVDEGKLSKEDYIKLTPNKGATLKKMEEKVKVEVLKNCSAAVGQLHKLVFPNRLTIKKKFGENMLTPKKSLFVSPLKRQQKIEFEFTQFFKANKNAQQNKQIINSIISTLDLETKGINPLKSRTLPSNMRDASVQTSTPFCDACAIRESMKYVDASTLIDQDAKRLFSSTVHTQVVEQDLLSSKTVFNPSGSPGGNANMSIAHMTPAQLVSQLAARAKTLKQNEASQSSQDQRRGWQNPQNYNYDGRGQHNNSNFKYF